MPNSCAVQAPKTFFSFALRAAIRAAFRAAIRAAIRAATHAPKHFFHALDSGRHFFHAPMAIGLCLWPWPLALATGHDGHDGHRPWPLAMANGHGHRSQARACGHGNRPRPQAMATSYQAKTSAERIQHEFEIGNFVFFLPLFFFWPVRKPSAVPYATPNLQCGSSKEGTLSGSRYFVWE